MPRRIPTQVGQTVSRLLQGGYLKEAPRSFETTLLYPPAPLPPRTPTPRPAYDSSFSSNHRARSATPPSEQQQEYRRRDPLNSKKKHYVQKPKLTPQPIVYLADRIRARFYKDHPWETLRPRVLVEAETLAPPTKLGPEATDLRYWGRNPGPEDVVACTIHLHEHHGLSLSQAYHHTLSSYHALRAEHETASRSALFEALAYGATFNNSSTLPGSSSSNSSRNMAYGTQGAAAETVRGFEREAKELAKGAAYFYQSQGGGAVAAAAAAAIEGAEGQQQQQATRAARIVNPSKVFSKGQQYLQAALASREMTGLPLSSPSSSSPSPISTRSQGLNSSSQSEEV